MDWRRYTTAGSGVQFSAEDARKLKVNHYYWRLEEKETCRFDYGVDCTKDALCRVYGLPFCEDHGPEAAAVALAEEADGAEDFLSSLCSAASEAFETNPQIHLALGEASKQTLFRYPAYDGVLDRLPLRHSLDTIDEEYKRILDSGCPQREMWPEDDCMDRLRDVVRTMRTAWSYRAADVIEALEPLREEAISQLVIVTRYTLVHQERIHAAYRAAKASA